MAKEKPIRRVQLPTYIPPKLKAQIEAAAKAARISAARWMEYAAEEKLAK